MDVHWRKETMTLKGKSSRRITITTTQMKRLKTKFSTALSSAKNLKWKVAFSESSG